MKYSLYGVEGLAYEQTLMAFDFGNVMIECKLECIQRAMRPAALRFEPLAQR